MTAEEVRLHMHELRDMKHELTEIFETLSIVRSKAERTTISYSKAVTSHSGHSDRVAAYSTQLVQINEELQNSYVRFIERSKSVNDMINLLSDPLWRCVCISYFMDCLSCDEVSKEVDHSKSAVSIILKKSCKEIAETIPIYMIPEEYLNH